MYATLTKPRLIAGIVKASPMSQTSALEGFHSVLNQFAPKMISYSFPGMFCRHILAVTHFNGNLDRDNQEVNGVLQVKVHYPKFKNGEAVVRNVKVAQDFGYVEDNYQVLCSALIDEETLRKAKAEVSPVQEIITNQRNERAAPRCTVYKNWMKGHKNIMNCPKNRK
ncbi:uncharacterized protein LOC124447773 [Xenia sp. Carnegie-2017]|uniref:uncharacterized protein LOC124447773 n=1 Tax=Xenia sp. Carnegie-2017 TaxID=2897299 RepID=UPI001F04E348|nr:uncharacterized protein LOC124447773 [Xenia sp. Carnegie-2017]